MANTVTKTTLLDGKRNTAILVNIVGDGSGEETATTIFDRSQFAPTDNLTINALTIDGRLQGFSAFLAFDATTDLPFAQLADGPQVFFHYPEIGGIPSSAAGAGANGNIVITTSGLGNGDRGTFILHLIK